MQSPRAKVLLGIVALALAVVLFIGLSGSDDESPTTSTSVSTTETLPTEPDGGNGSSDDPQEPDKPDKPEEPEIATIVVKDGVPVGGVQQLTFTEGDDIRFKVESDVADEVHFHGYDVGMEVEAGGSVTFDVPATITGEFEVELEERVTPLAEITVNPS